MTVAHDAKAWKDLPQWTLEDLWLIERSGNKLPFKLEYERLDGGFVPEIPYALMRRFSKPGWTVYDPMAGAMVTRRVGDKLAQNVISVDIQDRGPSDDPLYKELILADAREYDPGPVDLIVAHPPYRGIIKFTDPPNEADLSHMERVEFWASISKCLIAFNKCLKPNRMCAIVVGNIYRNRRVINLAHEMHSWVETINPGWLLKGWIIKDIVGNRQDQQRLWLYRACNSDSFVFNQETILVYKKEEE